MVWGQGIQDIVFYDTFESGDTSGWWAPARVGKTGQTTCYDQAGTVIDYEYFNPTLSNAAGTAQWTEGDVFAGVRSDSYWSSTSFAFDPSYACYVYLGVGYVYVSDKTSSSFVWPVRGGQ